MLVATNCCTPSLSVPINGVQLLKRWSSERCQVVSMFPGDLLDTVYPVNVLDHCIGMFLKESRMDYGGSLNEGALRAALRDIQDHISITYGLQAVTLYDLPETSRAWRALILRQPPPLCHRDFPEEQVSPAPLHPKNQPTTSRFAAPLKVGEKAFQPKKTKQATNWAVKIFDEWLLNRNSQCPVSFQCPRDLLSKPYPPAVIDQWLAAFIVEVRKSYGNYYSPTSLNGILAGIQRRLRESLGRAAPNIVDTNNTLFPKKRNALDQQLRHLRKIGVGVTKKRAPVITANQEAQLWETGTVGIHSPEALLNAMFFYNGKNFCLRGVSEQQELRFNQIHMLRKPRSIQYCEHGSKNNQGGLQEQRLTVKSVTINAVPGSQCCHVRIFQAYISHIPPSAIEQNQKFYLQPVDFPKPGQYWYSPKPLSANKLKSMVSKMFAKAEVEGDFTNHSLRATGVSTLFSSGVPEALIQNRSGHRLTESLRLYETRGVNDKHSQAISNILAGKSSNFQTQFGKKDADFEDDDFFSHVAQTLGEEEMDDETFMDNFCCELDA